MEVWNLATRRSFVMPGCGPHVFGPYRGVLHTTEGGSLAGALATYRKTGFYPHFTVDESTIEQHCPLNTGATALEHKSGIDTNRASAIQIEIVGSCDRAWATKNNLPFVPDWSVEQFATLIRLMRWIGAQTGIRPAADKPFSNTPSRFSDAEWRAYNGWCGHQHVPNQAHWDPGALPFSKLVPAVQVVKVKPMYDPPIVMEPWVASLKDRLSGGVWGVAASGAVYALEGAPYKGGANGQAYFAGRSAAQIVEPNQAELFAGRTYTIIDTAGERYAY